MSITIPLELELEWFIFIIKRLNFYIIEKYCIIIFVNCMWIIYLSKICLSFSVWMLLYVTDVCCNWTGPHIMEVMFPLWSYFWGQYSLLLQYEILEKLVTYTLNPMYSVSVCNEPKECSKNKYFIYNKSLPDTTLLGPIWFATCYCK